MTVYTPGGGALYLRCHVKYESCTIAFVQSFTQTNVHRVVNGALLGLTAAQAPPGIPLMHVSEFESLWAQAERGEHLSVAESQAAVADSQSYTHLTAVVVIISVLVVGIGVIAIAKVRKTTRTAPVTPPLSTILAECWKMFCSRYPQFAPGGQLHTSDRDLQRLEADLQVIIVRSKLTMGKYGPIYAGMKDGRAVRIESCEDQDVSSMQHFVVQCQLYHCLDHPNILKLEFVHLATQPLHRGFEAVDVGTLSQYLTARRPKLEQRLRIIQQVVGVQYP